MRRIVLLVAVALVGLTACASNGSSNSSSSSNGSSNGGSSSNNSQNGTSNGGSSNNGTTPSNGEPAGNVPTDVDLPSPPANFTLPKPDSSGEVKTPDQPPKEIRNKSPKSRLSSLPPVPRGCLDDDLTLLDVFAPFVSVPVRLLYCMLYVGTIARLPSEINLHVTVSSQTGQQLNVPLVAPDHTQRPIATLALIILVVAIAIAIGYVVGKRRGETRLAG